MPHDVARREIIAVLAADRLETMPKLIEPTTVLIQKSINPELTTISGAESAVHAEMDHCPHRNTSRIEQLEDLVRREQL